MNSCAFTIKKTKLLPQLRKIAKPLGKVSRWNQNMVLEITVTDQKVTLVIPGIKLELPAVTRGTAKMTMPFFYFFDIVKTLRQDVVECIITADSLELYGLHIAVETTFFEDDSILRSIKLPLNYTDFHLLRMDQQGFTIEEIRFNKLEFEIHHARKALKRNITKAHTLLKVYGIRRDEIERIVMSKVNISD